MTSVIHVYKSAEVEQLKTNLSVDNINIPALYVDLTNICKVSNRPLKDYLRRNETQSYIQIVCNQENLKEEQLIIKTYNKNLGRGATWGHPKVAIDLCCWISTELRYWAMSTILLVLQGEFQPITQRASDTKKALKSELDDIGFVTRDRDILEHNCEHLLNGLKLIHYQYSTMLMLVDTYLRKNPSATSLKMMFENLKSSNLVSGFKLRESFVPDLKENPEREYEWMKYKQHNSNNMLKEMMKYEQTTRINTQLEQAIQSGSHKLDMDAMQRLDLYERNANQHPLGYEE